MFSRSKKYFIFHFFLFPGEIEEDDMDEETEEDAIERIKDELIEKFEGEVSQVEGVQVG